MYCRNCGRPAGPGDDRCRYCGGPVRPDGGKEPKGKGSLLLFLVIDALAAIVITVLVAALVRGGRSSRQSPGQGGDEGAAVALAAERGREQGYKNATAEMTVQTVTEVEGDSYTRLRQNYKGIPVYGRTCVLIRDEATGEVLDTGNLRDVDEALDLTPTLTPEQARGSAVRYATAALGCTDAEALELSELSPERLVIWNLDDDAGDHLAYTLSAGFPSQEIDEYYELVMDAHTGEVYLANSLVWADTLSDLRKTTIRQEVVGDLQGERVVHNDVPYVTYLQLGEYALEDSERGITGLRLDSELQWSWSKFAPVYVTSADTDMLYVWYPNQAPQAHIVDMYAHAQISYDYFVDRFHYRSTDGNGKAQVYVASGWDVANTDAMSYADNAFCRNDLDNNATFLIGGKRTWKQYHMAAYLDVVAHEYTHGVEHYISGMIYQDQSGALMEALSDIFGELVDAWYAKQEPDWSHGASRNLRDPGSSGFPTQFLGDRYKIGEEDHGYVHQNSTVISHAAWQMWAGYDGDPATRLSEDELSELFFRTMLTLPSDCNFQEFRRLTELAAQRMSLSDRQRACVSRAFDDAHIWNDYFIVTPGAMLRVYGADGALYGNYDFTAYLDTAAPNLSTGVQMYHATVDRAEPLALDFPAGTYRVTLRDLSGGSDDVKITVCLRPAAWEDHLDLYTDFLSAGSAEPDLTWPDFTDPDLTWPDFTEPDFTEPDPTEPDPTGPDPTEPDPGDDDLLQYDPKPGNIKPVFFPYQDLNHVEDCIKDYDISKAYEVAPYSKYLQDDGHLDLTTWELRGPDGREVESCYFLDYIPICSNDYQGRKWVVDFFEDDHGPLREVYRKEAHYPEFYVYVGQSVLVGPLHYTHLVYYLD